MAEIPWNDAAIASVADGAFRRIVAQGTLAEILLRLDPLRDDHLIELVISFPERSARPFRYTQAELPGLREQHAALRDAQMRRTWLREAEQKIRESQQAKRARPKS